MKDDKTSKVSLETDSIDPTEALVTSILKRTQDSPKGHKLIDDHWHKIQSEKPALARLISVNTFRQAPNDAEARELISTSMILMDIVNHEMQIQDHLKDSIGESMSQYFPL
jgi:hypothetical protein